MVAGWAHMVTGWMLHWTPVRTCIACACVCVCARILRIHRIHRTPAVSALSPGAKQSASRELDLVPAGNPPRPPAAAPPLCIQPRLRLRPRSSSPSRLRSRPTLRLRPHPHPHLRPRRACCRARRLLFVAAHPSHPGLLQRAAPSATGGVAAGEAAPSRLPSCPRWHQTTPVRIEAL